MQKIAGLLFFLGGSIVVLGIMAAEIFYPQGYNTALDMISTLGSTPPPERIIKEPAAAIFDYSMIISGLFIILGAYSLFSAKYERSFVFVLALMGIGALGVGLFPAYHAVVHPIAALITFFFGAIAAILSASVVSAPFRYVALLFGIIGIAFLAIGTFAPGIVVPILGKGGTERFIAYPILLWLCAFGGYLMSKTSKK